MIQPRPACREEGLHAACKQFTKRKHVISQTDIFTRNKGLKSLFQNLGHIQPHFLVLSCFLQTIVSKLSTSKNKRDLFLFLPLLTNELRAGDAGRRRWLVSESFGLPAVLSEEKRRVFLLCSKRIQQKKKTPLPGIEPGSPAWQAGILTTILQRLTLLIESLLVYIINTRWTWQTKSQSSIYVQGQLNRSAYNSYFLWMCLENRSSKNVFRKKKLHP